MFKIKKEFEDIVFKEDCIEFQKFCKITNDTKIIIVDREDFNKVKNVSFYGRNKEYVKCGDEILHRAILNYTGDLMVDHINGNTLDNRKNNLRIVSQSENQRNLHSFKRNNTGIIGIQKRRNGNYDYFRVSWREEDGKRKTKQFNIGKLGEETAFQLSKDFLKKQHLKNGYMIKF